MNNGERIVNRAIKTAGLAAFFLCLFISVSALAGDKLINVQGKLTDSANNPIDGSRTVTFRFYQNLGDPVASRVWEDTRGVLFSGGLFNISLGTTTSLDNILFSRPYYLGIQVAGDASEMSPRQPLGASAYALGSIGDFNVGKGVSVTRNIGFTNGSMVIST